MIPSVAWPESLPAPLIEGLAAQAVNPVMATQLASGRTRLRRAFTAVPIDRSMSWMMTSEQASRFEEFYAEDLQDGTLWFAMRLLLPQGRGPWPFRFSAIYSGPEMIGSPAYPRWRYSANLQQWLRPVDADPLDPEQYRELETGGLRILE